MRKIPICNACRHSQLDCTCQDDSLWDDSCNDTFLVTHKRETKIVIEKNNESKEIDIMTGLVDKKEEIKKEKEKKRCLRYYYNNKEKRTEYQKKYAVGYKEKHRENALRYVQRNRAKVMQRQRERYWQQKELKKKLEQIDPNI